VEAVRVASGTGQPQRLMETASRIRGSFDP